MVPNKWTNKTITPVQITRHWKTSINSKQHSICKTFINKSRSLLRSNSSLSFLCCISDLQAIHGISTLQGFQKSQTHIGLTEFWIIIYCLQWFVGDDGMGMCCEKKTMIGWRNVWNMRPRGRPNRTWKEVVPKDCQSRNLNREDAMDHGRRKKLIKIGWSGWVSVSSGTGSSG